jgi:hypothetical protein
MTRPKHILRCTAVYCLVDPSDLEDLVEATEWLESLLHGPCDIETVDGEDVIVERRELVDRIGGMKIEVYPNEHPPPHFHVRSPVVSASFAIDDCSLLNGTVGPREFRKIRYWHRQFKPYVVQAWNDTRPTDCKVGSYRERSKESKQ